MVFSFKGSDNALSHHCVSNLQEACNVCAEHEVAGLAALDGCVVASLEDVLHDALQLLVNFFESPAHADGVLAHFETGSCNAASVGCLAGAVEQAVAENLLDCFRGKRHICAFEYCHATVVDKVLYVVSVHLVLGCARHCDVALEGPDALAAFVILGAGNFVCVNADACAALLLDVHDLLEINAVGIVDVAVGVAHCDNGAAELGALLGCVLSNVAAPETMTFLPSKEVFARWLSASAA